MVKIRNGGQLVKLMFSYGGKIQPRRLCQQLSYVGGDTKILTVDRHIKFPDIVAKLQALCSFTGDGFCIKYQLPGEDLNVLISLTNEDDLENMMIEYDCLRRKISPAKPARFRLFLSSFTESDAIQQKLVNSCSDSSGNPDYLFGFDEDYDYSNNSNSTTPEFDLEAWTIPKVEVTGNTCSVNVNKSEKLESRDGHVANGQCVVNSTANPRRIHAMTTACTACHRILVWNV